MENQFIFEVSAVLKLFSSFMQGNFRQDVSNPSSSPPAPALVPPRAQYFVIVGGLACCKDDLGCAR